jgi:hypothetical protein
MDKALLASRIERLDTACCVISRESPDNHIVCTNSAFAALTGFGHEIHNQTLETLEGEGTNPAVFQQLLAVLQCSEPATLVLTSYTKTKRPFLNRIDCKPERNLSGVVTHHVLNMAELTPSSTFTESNILETLRQHTQPEDVTIGFPTPSSDTQSEGNTCSSSSSEEQDELGQLFLNDYDSNPFPALIDVERHSFIGTSTWSGIFGNDLSLPQALHAHQSQQEQQEEAQEQEGEQQLERRQDQEERACASVLNDASNSDGASSNSEDTPPSEEQPKRKRCVTRFLYSLHLQATLTANVLSSILLRPLLQNTFDGSSRAKGAAKRTEPRTRQGVTHAQEVFHLNIGGQKPSAGEHADECSSAVTSESRLISTLSAVVQ